MADDENKKPEEQAARSPFAGCLILIVMALVILVLIASAAYALKKQTSAFVGFTEEEMLERFPELATYYSLPGARHDDLFDNSLDAQADWQEREDAWLRELEEIGTPTDIGSRDWVTFGILHEQLVSSISSRAFLSGAR